MDDQYHKINILGFGTMAKQIAALFFLGGFDIVIWNRSMVNEADLTMHVNVLKRSLCLEGQGSIKFSYDVEKLPNTTTIECVAEDLHIKQELYNRLSPHIAGPYFTNSSSFSAAEIGARVNALHFFNPINIKVVELYLCSSDPNPNVETIRAFLNKTGYDVVSVKGNRGYIGNYLLFHEISSVFRLIELNNYSMADITSVYNKLYGGRDVFAIIDQIGIDVANAILLNLSERDAMLYVPACFNKALDSNILGKKNKTSIKQVLS